MALRDQIPLIVNEYQRLIGQGGLASKNIAQFNPEQRTIESTFNLLEHNRKLFDIYEGDLLTYVLQDLRNQLSPKSYEQIKHRAAPINVLKRLIDKQSKIYIAPPMRETDSDADKDKELLEWYCKKFDINTNMQMANEFFNLFKTCAIEPYLDNGCPKLRILPSDRFFVYSTDPIAPTKPTHFVKIMGKLFQTDTSGKDLVRTILYVYTDEEFLAIDERGAIVQEIMDRIENPDGINPFGRIPFVYINRSRHDLIPKPDTDTLAMAKLIPVLLSDINYAVMYQCFSIIYGVDLDQEGLTMAPNAFWSFKSDPAKETKPEVGIIKPQADIDKVLQLIQTELSMWLTSRNIKPGAMGTLNPENMASGIAKAIDEMDTSEDRQKQVPYFQAAERELWDLIITCLHPIWMRDPDFQNKMAFSPGICVNVTFPAQKPLVDPSRQVDDVIKKIQAGLQSRAGGIKELYPDWDDDQVEDLMEEIEMERTLSVDQMAGENPTPAEQSQDMAEMMPDSEMTDKGENQPGNAGVES